MIQTILQILLCLGFFYLLFLNFKQQNEVKELNSRISDLEKQLKVHETTINNTTVSIRKLDEYVSSFIRSQLLNFKEIEKKIYDLYDRWNIISDERIDSIPVTTKDWHLAKEIVSQAKPKIWKAKNLSQSKSSMISSGSNKIEEINQDFSEIDDSLLDNILDEEDTDTSSATDNTQAKKSTQKQQSNQMKM